jgi:hypothetical protein
MSGPELTRRLTLLRDYHRQLTAEIQHVEADWAAQYARWQHTQADADAVACVQYEHQVATLKKTRELTMNAMTRYERLVMKGVGKARKVVAPRRPFGCRTSS